MDPYSHLSAALRQQLDIFDPAKEYSGVLPKISSTSHRTYYVKEGSASEQEQYTGEAESLKAIEKAAPGLAPHLYASGAFNDGDVYFISEYKEIGPLTNNAANELAKRLASELHQFKSLNGFGFEVPTYCGPTRFKNGWYETWEGCYSAMYEALISRLREEGNYKRLCDVGDVIIQEVIPKLLGPLVIQPVLLHGDLWSGNTGEDTKTGHPVIFDPASFYGHNEADLAIARIFGGFPLSFFDAYFKYNPKTEPVEHYTYRSELYESFHYLNHTLIFGGHYGLMAEKKMKRLIEANLHGELTLEDAKKRGAVTTQSIN